jgi:hypothetical protein
MSDSSHRDHYASPSEYGGAGGDNLRAPSGRPRPLAPGEEAQRMRSEAIRTADDWPAASERRTGNRQH